MKTFKVKAPSDDKARFIWGAGMQENTSGGMTVGHINYNNLVVGTDGYLYVMHMKSSPGNDSSIAVSYFGIMASVDDMATVSSGYSYGSGA